jgi:hypothetical protein
VSRLLLLFAKAILSNIVILASQHFLRRKPAIAVLFLHGRAYFIRSAAVSCGKTWQRGCAEAGGNL